MITRSNAKLINPEEIVEPLRFFYCIAGDASSLPFSIMLKGREELHTRS